jgi:glycosyltransferase involved in cell wall biosynthesis
MKVVIDARFYGLENAGLGRYTINLINQLQNIDTRNNYIILLRKKYYESLRFQTNFEKELADIPHYSFDEQIKLPKLIRKHNPDITHFLHFNVPLTFTGKFIVTIHDMTMHTQKTTATNLFLPVYLAKHALYKRVFRNSIVKSQKIIVPSQFVKDDLLKNFKINKNKISVTYEGI